MAVRVTRRDFLNGVAIGTGGLILSAYGSDLQQSDVDALTTPTQIAPAGPQGYYPPVQTGMRGSHPGSFEVAHALAWRGEKPAHYHSLDEHYDLVIVGAGLSGLATAWFYRKKMGPAARILLLDNHDDFGGHARRNEFHHKGRMVLSLGGAQNLENPGSYSDAATGLLADIGIDQDFLEAMDANTPEDFALGGKFDADMGMAIPGPGGHITVGGNWLKIGYGGEGYQDAVRALPLAVTEQDKLIAFLGGERDFLEDLSLGEKWDYVNSVSYNQFLLERVNLAPETLPILSAPLSIYAGLTGANLTVLEAFSNLAGGVKATGWLGKLAGSLGVSLMDALTEVRMFPDGNASVARLLVHKLIPEVAPGMRGVEDVAVTHFDYDQLDRADLATRLRLRLNSTVVGVRQQGAERVQVDYVQQGKSLRITADHCVLACYNALIPHLCPELPEPQKEGLRYGVKAPFVYANVLLDNGQAFSRLGATMFQCPYDPFQWVSSAPSMSTSGYQPPRGPDDPMAVFMMSSPVPVPDGKISGRDMLRFGRHKIYNTPFGSYESEIRNQLQGLLGKHGFSHESDIRAITVNRIPHGYSYSYLGLDDPEWEQGQAPHEVGRAQFGRISIANTDSEALAYMDAAFDAAWRAVEEQSA